MMYALLSMVIAIVIWFGFRRLHPQAKIERQHVLYYFLLCIFAGFILQSYENIFLWLVFFGLLHAALTDFHESRISILLPVWLSLLAFFSDATETPFWWVTGFGVLFILLDFLWTRFASKQHDILFLFPLLYLPFFEHDHWVAYAVFLSVALFARLTAERFVGEGDAYVFYPLLLLTDNTWFASFFLFSLLIALPFAVLSLRRKQEDFPFAPYLLGGFVIVHAHEVALSLAVLVCSFLASLLLAFLPVQAKGEKK